MNKGRLKEVLSKMIQNIVVEEVEKAKVILRKEMYILMESMEKKPKPAVKTITNTSSNTKEGSIREILSSVTPFTNNSYDYEEENIQADNSIIHIPNDVKLQTPVKKIVDVLNNTDFAAKVKAMEESSKRRRELL